MVAIAPGTFVMGANDGRDNEKPARSVTLTKPFWIGKYEVTHEQYQAVTGKDLSHFPGEPDAAQRPVEGVTWDDAKEYCRMLTARERAEGRVPDGYQYRLPTEAEWEYCCRAGTTTPWHTGTNLTTSQANIKGALGDIYNIGGRTEVVGRYAPNAFGLHDMHGNVQEWCLDSYARYEPDLVTDPFVGGQRKSGSHVIRGGDFMLHRDESECRSTYRTGMPPGYAAAFIGFRVVLAEIIFSW